MTNRVRWSIVFAVVILTACTLGVVSAAGKPATGETGAPSRETALSVQREVESLSSRVDVLQAKVAAAQQELESTETRVKAGLTHSSDLIPLRLKLMELADQLKQAQSVLADVRRLAVLAKPVDVDMKHASIGRVAEVLSRVSGVSITVDTNVPKDLYVSAQAKRIPLGTVLELVADSAGLTIEPGSRGGMILALPGKLQINGKDGSYRSGNWPWSDAWMTRACGDSYCPLGRRWMRMIDCTLQALPAYDAQNGTASGPKQASVTSSPPVALATSEPNTVIVGEPGSGPNGEKGIWLTFYHLVDGKLEPGARYFHRLGF